MEFYEAFKEAAKLIKANHTGANTDEAQKLLRKAGEAVKTEKFEEAVNLPERRSLQQSQPLNTSSPEQRNS